MKTLIVVGHPDMQHSVINKRWAEELAKYPDRFTVHILSQVYPDERIDVEKEQQLIEAHDRLILQYPIYWFNCPAFLKKWLDCVFTEGWAYGPGGDKLKDKRFALAVSAGMRESDFRPDGECRATVDQLIQPFRTTALYTGLNFSGCFVQYGSHHVAPEALEKSARDYVRFISGL